MSEADPNVASASNSALKQSEKLTQIKEAAPLAVQSNEGTGNGTAEQSEPNGKLQVNGNMGSDGKPQSKEQTPVSTTTEEAGKEEKVPEKTADKAEGENVKEAETESKEEKKEKEDEKEKDTVVEKKEGEERKEEDMEVNQPEVASSTVLPPVPTPKQTRKRRSLSKTSPTKEPGMSEESPRKRGRSPAVDTPQSEGRVKRQRRQVEKFQAPTATPEPQTPASPSSVRIYDKNATLAVRADGASFFLCRCVNHVLNTNKRFKVRWFEIEQDPDLYRLAYEDKVELECVICPAHLQRAHRGLFRLVPSELERIQQLLKAAERGEDVTKLDPNLFKPQTSIALKLKAEEAKEASDADDGNDTDVLEDEEPEPRPKRSRKRRSTDSPKPKTTPKPRAEKGSPRPRASAKVATKGRGRKAKKLVSIAQADTVLRRITTMNLQRNLTLQRTGSFFNRPSLIKKLSLQKWPSQKIKLKKAKLEPGAKRPPRPPPDPNRKLRHNPRVTVWERDPLFESRIEVPFVSSVMHSRLAIRAALLNDTNMMKKVMEDTTSIHQVNVQRSLHSDKTTMSYAILSENRELIKLLHDDGKNFSKVRPSPPRVRLHVETTGHYNPRTLPGVKVVRKIQISRGGREGNNALSKDVGRSYSPSASEHGILALRNNISYEVIRLLLDMKMLYENDINEHICEAVRFGHRNLAAKLMEDAEKLGGFGFNFMHKESLKFDGEEFSGKLLEVSAVKKPQENRKMLPIHCAAINPNTKYLTTMLALCSDINIEDADKRRPIHYAAACETTGPLELLINKGVSLNEGDSKGWTPLIIACITGRPENVKLILKHLTEVDSNLVLPRAQKFGPGGVNRPMKNTWCPLHFAVANKRKEVMKVLIEHGADVNKHLGANFNRITPLMMVAQDGDLHLLRFLISHKAKVEKPDKLKRTALIHAVRDGNANVVSHLLNIGADPNITDSSGNRAIHYAAAYGWYFCMKALLDAGADPDPPNDWKLTPLGAAFLKGNQGLTQVLIDIPGVNVNFQDEEGLSLVLHALNDNDLTEQVLKDFKLLVVDKNAKVTLADKGQRNAFHYLFKKNLCAETDHEFKENNNFAEKYETQKRVMREITDIILERGCDPWAKDIWGENVFSLVLKQSDERRNLDLLEYLMKKGMKEMDLLPKEKSDNTLFHTFCEDLENKGNMRLLKMISGMQLDGKSGADLLKEMAKVREPSSGHTPFIKACYYHSSQREDYRKTNEEFLNRMKRQREFLRSMIVEFQSEVEYSYEKKISQSQTQTLKITALQPLLDTHYLEPAKSFRMVMEYKANVDFRLANGSTLLLNIASGGQEGVAQTLIAAGADVNIKSQVKDEGEMTPLLIAISSGQFNMAKYLITKGADVKALRADDKRTVLHLAIQNIGSGQIVEAVKLFLEKGADINCRDGNLRTPLHMVANKSTDSADESKELEQFLLKSGADPFIKDCNQRLPLHYIFSKMHRDQDCSQIDPVESYTIFSMAMKHQHLDDADKLGQTILHKAAMRGSTVCCMLLLQREVQINAQDNDGNTPLSFAVWKGHDSCAITLIQKGADINSMIIKDPLADIHPDKRKKLEGKVAVNGPVTDDSEEDMEVDINDVIRSNIRKIKEKPVWKVHRHHYPAKWKPGLKGHPIFQGLVMNGWQGVTFLAMDILEKFGMEYAAAVEIAIVLGKFRFAKKLMNKQLDSEKLRVKNEKKQTLLHVLAKTAIKSDFYLQQQVVDELINERDVKVNDQDENGSTAMHFAVLGRHWQLVNYLLSHSKGLVLQISDKFGRTPLALFQWDGTVASNEQSERALAGMIRHGGRADILVDYPPTDILRKGYPPQVDSSEYYQPYPGKKISPLIKAIIDRNIKVLHILLDRGASPDFPDSDGITPLMYAVKTGRVDILNLLFNKNFDLERYSRMQKEELGKFQDGKKPIPKPTDDDLFAGCKKVTKNREINVNAVDPQGRSVVHHLLCALSYGTLTDLTILKMLHDVGAKLDMKDKNGKAPLNQAMEQRAVTMAKGIQSLLGVSKTNWQIPSFRPFTVDDSITWEGGEIDFAADSEAELKKMEAEQLENLKDDPWWEIDDRIDLPLGEVVMDKELGIPYDILMTKVDVKIGEYGLYNFYKMQVIHDEDKDMIILYNCWGRIGDSGQYQKTPMKNIEEATEEFSKIFKAKSGNEWKDVKSFENKPKRYRLVDADHRRQNKQKEVKFDLTSKLPSKLPSYIQDLVTELSNVTMLRKSMSDTQIDIPFGRLKKDVILKARELLQELHELADKLTALESHLTTDNLEEYRQLSEQVSELSSEFYYLLPLRGYAYESLTPLKDKGSVQKYIQTLTQLLELQYVGAILLGAQHRSKEMNPSDYIYRAIRTRIQTIPQASPESEAIMRYIYADYANTRPDIEAIYRVERQGEPERLLDANIDNHCLLWHGSRTSNLLGILSRGLLIAPKDAPLSGMRYGKGIYTADRFDKSQQYTYNDGGGRSKYMLLCEVALGRSAKTDEGLSQYPPADQESVIGNGSNIPDPRYTAILPTGATIPFGPLVDNPMPSDRERTHFSFYWRHRSEHNEFIVYKEDQVCLRYIVQFR